MIRVKRLQDLPIDSQLCPMRKGNLLFTLRHEAIRLVIQNDDVPIGGDGHPVYTSGNRIIAAIHGKGTHDGDFRLRPLRENGGKLRLSKNRQHRLMQ